MQHTHTHTKRTYLTPHQTLCKGQYTFFSLWTQRRRPGVWLNLHKCYLKCTIPSRLPRHGTRRLFFSAPYSWNLSIHSLPFVCSLSLVMYANFASHLFPEEKEPWCSRLSGEAADVSCFLAQGGQRLQLLLWEASGGFGRRFLVCGLSGVWQVPMCCCSAPIQYKSLSTVVLTS